MDFRVVAGCRFSNATHREQQEKSCLKQTGNRRAVTAVKDTNCQFATPAEGDWLLVLKAGK
ncbi:MAG: hypothetical protein EXS35_15720 [Pedosphaera sp.]|nr:hypothetical protein [Pedosphaera sp.]